MENLAWELVKHDYTNFMEEDDQINERILNLLFCIFNRFCDPEKLPMVLPGKALNYIFHELEIRSSLSSWQDNFDFTEFIIIMKNYIIKDGMVGKVKRFHVKIVQNTLIEGRLRYRIIQNGGYSILNWKSLTGMNHTFFQKRKNI